MYCALLSNDLLRFFQEPQIRFVHCMIINLFYLAVFQQHVNCTQYKQFIFRSSSLFTNSFYCTFTFTVWDQFGWEWVVQENKSDVLSKSATEITGKVNWHTFSVCIGYYIRNLFSGKWHIQRWNFIPQVLINFFRFVYYSEYLFL